MNERSPFSIDVPVNGRLCHVEYGIWLGPYKRLDAARPAGAPATFLLSVGVGSPGRSHYFNTVVGP